MENFNDIKAMVTDVQFLINGSLEITVRLNGKGIKIEYFCAKRGDGAKAIATAIDAEDMEYIRKALKADGDKAEGLLGHIFFSTLSKKIEIEGEESVLEELEMLEEEAKQGQVKLKRLRSLIKTELDEYSRMREKQQSDCINTENIVQ